MYNHEEIEKANKKKGMFVSSFVHALLVLLLLFYAAPNVEALDEGGLIASFGDVELAGPSEASEEEVTPEEQPEEVVEEEVIEEEVEEVINSETIDDSDVALSEEKPKEPKKEPKKEPAKEPKKEPVRKPKGPMSFNGKNKGSGTATGDGKQGNKLGKIDGKGFGDKDGKGNGNGLGTRMRTSSKCDISVGSLKTDSRVIFKICVNAEGTVTSVELESSDVDSQSLLNKAKSCVRQWKYNPVPGAKSACGNVEFTFNLR